MRIVTPAITRHALLVAIMVGTVLKRTYQGGILFHRGDVGWGKLILTHSVP